MTITALLMILALAAGSGTPTGSGTAQPVQTDSALCQPGRVCRIASNCWINGVWYNPCPDSDPAPPPPPPVPDVLMPL